MAFQPLHASGRSKAVEDLLNDRPPAEAADGEVGPLNLWVASLKPGDYAANRELMRRVFSYLAAVQLATKDPQLRLIARGASQRLLWLGLPLTNDDSAPPTAAAVHAAGYVPEAPPFQRQAPVLAGVSEADRPIASELQTRYDAAAGDATTAWQSAEVLRRDLTARKLGLNVETEAALTRIRLYLDTAYRSLRAKAWADTRLNIERAEYETGKVHAAVGR